MRPATRKPLRGVARAVLLVGGLALLNGCETIERAFKDNSQTAVGSGAGGAGGATVGDPAGAPQGAVIGGLTGVLTGGVVGNVLDRQERTRAATAEIMAYSGEEGDIVRIEQVSLNPQSIRPGETVDLNVQYAVLSRGGTEPARVREIRHIYYQGDLVGNPVVQVERPNGTYWSTLPLKVPPSATPGRYEVVVGVEMNGTLDRWESRFTVLQP
jgi:outer membrane lipoprotein SlyB